MSHHCIVHSVLKFAVVLVSVAKGVAIVGLARLIVVVYTITSLSGPRLEIPLGISAVCKVGKHRLVAGLAFCVDNIADLKTAPPAAVRTSEGACKKMAQS